LTVGALRVMGSVIVTRDKGDHLCFKTSPTAGVAENPGPNSPPLEVRAQIHRAPPNSAPGMVCEVHPVRLIDQGGDPSLW